MTTDTPKNDYEAQRDLELSYPIRDSRTFQQQCEDELERINNLPQDFATMDENSFTRYLAMYPTYLSDCAPNSAPYSLENERIKNRVRREQDEPFFEDENEQID